MQPTHVDNRCGQVVWITRPAAVDNYPQRMWAVCGCPVDGVGTSDGVADRGSGETRKSSTSGHTLCKWFCLPQVIEHKALFVVIHRRYPPLSTTTICIHKEKGKPIDRLASLLSTTSKPAPKQNAMYRSWCDGLTSQGRHHAGLRNLRAMCRYKAHMPAASACRYHVALGAAPRRLRCVFYLLLKGVKQ